MQVQFKGITYIRSGDEAQLDARLDALSEQYPLGIPARWGSNEGVFLTGEDVVEFVKSKTGVELPRELMALPKDEVQEPENMAKLAPFIPKLQEAFMDVYESIDEVFKYYQAKADADNKDAEGKPIVEEYI